MKRLGRALLALVAAHAINAISRNFVLYARVDRVVITIICWLGFVINYAAAFGSGTVTISGVPCKRLSINLRNF
jgi:hypothetical protein